MSEDLAREFVKLIAEAQKLIPKDAGMYSAEGEWHARADTAIKRAEIERR